MTGFATSDPLEIEYTNTRAHAVDANVLFTRARRRKAAAIFAAFALLGLVLWLIAYDWTAMVLLVGATLAGAFELTRASVWLIVRFNESTLRVGTKLKVTLKAGGISVQTAGINAEYGWQAVTKVLEDGKAIVLMQGKAPLLAMSKRAFAAGGFDAFKDFVRSAAPSAEWHAR